MLVRLPHRVFRAARCFSKKSGLSDAAKSGSESKQNLSEKLGQFLNNFTSQQPEMRSRRNVDYAALAEMVPPPKFYASVCEEAEPDYDDYENMECLFGPQDDYEFTMKLGRGRYSEVYRAVNLLENRDVVVKILKPVKKLKVRREIKILKTL